MVINVLANSSRGSVFLVSYNASNSSTDATKMYNLFAKTIEKVGKENVVQVVTDNASENVSAVFSLSRQDIFLHQPEATKNLRKLVLSNEWKENRYAKEAAGVLRMVDGERKPPMGYLYEDMDRAKETIEASFEGDLRKYEKVFEIIDRGDDLDWGSVSMAAGVEENIYSLRRSSSSSNNKGKGVATSSSQSLIDEDSEDEADDSQYNANIFEVQEFENLEEE
ncbi:uncharacterized protein [Nicotiana sylvestris]|uniref:uncharacterized protein n=1 Tax=Nicotiana sylvestris TaxID=4096 RepID=UPI00388CDEA0